MATFCQKTQNRQTVELRPQTAVYDTLELQYQFAEYAT